MSELGWVVVVLGAATEVGREVQSVLAERAVPIDEWRLYDTIDEADAISPDDLPATLLTLDAVDVGGADVVFLCGCPDVASTWAARGTAAGAIVIDLVSSLDEGTAPLVVPEVNAELISDFLDDGRFACPVPSATALAVTLKPIDAAAEIRRVVVTALEPASQLGTAGVDELADQTRNLLTGASVDATVFPQRLAFNVIPQSGEILPGGRTRAEWLLESQTRTLLDLPDLPISATSITVPTFYGQAYVVQVETERPLDAEAAEAILRTSPGIVLGEGGEYPTLADVIGSDATHVGRVRDDPTVPYGLVLWVVIDGLRKGAAANAVQIAERAVRERH